MKLAPFFVVSAALHAVAFFYPVPFVPLTHEELIPVTVVATDQLTGESGAAGIAKTTEISKPTVRTGLKKATPANFLVRRIPRVADVEEQALSTRLPPAREGTQAIAARISEPEEQLQPPENPPGFTKSSDAKSPFLSSRVSDGGGSVGSDVSGGKSQGSSGGERSGSGSGTGSGSESLQRESRFIPARYRESPKPFYPESARREGKEGRVLLRVLVDQEGKSKTVEVSGSSGSETLDHAAAEIIKRWRFSPARYGDEPVESWVRIPIDFRLTETKN